ncbi:hypothetical protein [Stygiolobus sp. RP850M]|uniref:hypothetical protein n=1 Tax=Stygiolobus sp. RP850M TaxID=3133137 RepID=UPI00307D6AE8
MDGRIVAFPSTSPNELRVTVCYPLRGTPMAELKVIKSKESYTTGKYFIYQKQISDNI